MGATRESRVRPEVSSRPDASSRAGAGRYTRLVFLVSLTVLAAAYTAMALDMDWRTTSGLIGPGFFPRIVGGLTVLGCLVAIARDLRGMRSPRPEGGPVDDAGDQRTDARVTVAAVAGMLVFLWFFEALGALLSSVLFLALMLTVVNRGHHRVNAAVSVLLPLGLCLLFEVLLDAGLPPGLVLPL